MKPSRMILASIFVTAVVLVIVGGVTAMAMSNKTAAADASATLTAQQAQQREQQYQQLVQQANQQLEKANADLKAMQARLDQFQQAGGQPQSAAGSAAPAAQVAAKTQVKVSADQASALAQKAADPSAVLQKKAELVNYQGQTVYEVTFDKGPVYVDANSGEVLFNGTVPQTIDAKTAAKVASQYLNIPDVLQTDKIQFRGQTVYRVIFKNGTIAYLDMTGQIFYVIPYNPNTGSNLLASNSGGGGGGGGGGFHEGGDGGHDD